MATFASSFLASDEVKEKKEIQRAPLPLETELNMRDLTFEIPSIRLYTSREINRGSNLIFRRCVDQAKKKALRRYFYSEL